MYMMRAYSLNLLIHLSTSMGKAFSWCIVILMGGTVYEVVNGIHMHLISLLFGILILVCRCMVQY